MDLIRNGSLTELEMDLIPIGERPVCVVSPNGKLNEMCDCFLIACKGFFSFILNAYDLKLFADAMICFFLCFTGQ